MTAKEVLVRGYAEALAKVAEAEGELDAVERQIYAFAKTVEREPKLREALTDPALPAENKRGLVADALGERANPLAVSLLGLIVEQGRARDLARIVETFAEVVAGQRELAVAEVRSAVPLSDAQSRKLAQALSKATGRQVELRVVVDPSVVGGVIARVGDEIFDGSLRSRLDDAREHMSG